MKWRIAFLLVLNHLLSFAQSDTIDMIATLGPEVNIEGAISQGIILRSQSSDQSVSEVLSRSTGVQIHSQGGPYLQTVLYRGQSARHMAILWQGVNIQNSFNGTYDMGLISSALFDKSKWYDGGRSATLGTAAMSGALVLDHERHSSTASVGYRHNDMNNRRLDVSFNTTIGKFAHQIKALRVDNENAFRYLTKDQIVQRSNSGHQQSDITYTMHTQWSNGHRSQIHYWYQSADRMLAPSTIATNQAMQQDVNHRLSIGHDWQFSTSSLWTTKLAYMKEDLTFSQPGIESVAHSDIINFQSKIKIEGAIDHTFGVVLRYEDGALSDTINPAFESFFPNRNTAALFYSGIVSKGISQLSFSIRQEAIDSEVQIPTGQLELHQEYTPDLSASFKVGRHFSYPGFNDLYWPIGGNSDLKSENSWQLEGGVEYKDISLTMYQMYTKNKILWAPNEQNIWTPENVSSTRSTGVELVYKNRWKFNDKTEWLIQPLINYNHSINTASGVNEGNELLYNPRLNLRLLSEWKYRNFAFRLDGSYTSERYQSLDNVTKLDPYHLWNAKISYDWIVHQRYKANMYVGAKNILDQSFELVRFFPQPLRSIYIGIKFSIK